MSAAQNARKRSKAPRNGRHRRDLDRLGRYVRQEAGSDPVVESELTTMRGLADQLDRMEADESSSAQTFALSVQRYNELRVQLVSRLGAHHGSGDPLADALAAALAGSGGG